MRIGSETGLITLIGDPVSHSRSPLIQNTALDAAGIDAVYVAARVSAPDLGRAVDGLRALGYLGANVTIPHKQRVMDYLDDLTGTARAVGAVNTILVEQTDSGCRLTGDNTDAAGFADVLRRMDGPLPESALVLGAGGSARAVVYGCLHMLDMTDVRISARREEQTVRLIDHMDPDGARTRCVPWARRMDEASDVELIVNATPLGMAPDSAGTPLPDAGGIGAGHVVYDLVYAPAKTRLIRASDGRGARTIGGIEMLIGQAAESFRRWTGTDMPREPVRRALREAGA